MPGQRVSLYLDQLDYDRLELHAKRNHLSVPAQAAKLLAEAVRGKRLGPPAAPEDEVQEGDGTLHVSSLFGYKSRKPRLVLTYDAPGKEFNVTMSIAAALNHAQDVNEVAMSAVSDAFLIDWLAETVHLEEGQAAQLLSEFRVWREKHRE